MKFSILLFLCLFAVSARGQITLEHSYPYDKPLGLVAVDSGTWKYVRYNRIDSIEIYNMDHSFQRVIQVPLFGSPGWSLMILAQRLFDVDSAYEYLLYFDDTANANQGQHGMRVYKENGDLLFACDTCQPAGIVSFALDNMVEYVRQTDHGSKFLVRHGQRIEVYSLPGKLPSCPATAGVVNSAGFLNEANLSSSAYPNPSSGPIHITYELPAGVSHGEIILTSEDGREVKRYRVTNAFSDIVLQNSEMESGSYFYTVVTERGASAAKRIVVVR